MSNAPIIGPGPSRRVERQAGRRARDENDDEIFCQSSEMLLSTVLIERFD